MMGRPLNNHIKKMKHKTYKMYKIIDKNIIIRSKFFQSYALDVALGLNYYGLVKDV